MANSKAYRMGKRVGQSRGSWVIDGNTDAKSAQRIIDGFEEGDSAVLDLCPSPLGGESISELSDRYGIDLLDPDNADDFEAGFESGFWDVVILAAKVYAS
jgi:hypothetical protein